MSKAKKDLQLHSLLQKAIPSNLTDRELIEGITNGDKSAFTALVARHTPMVLGVCLRVLPTIQDAEDACQAVFLVLHRNLHSTRWKVSISNWLYTTARQVALRARRSHARRVVHETEATVTRGGTSPLDQMTLREALLALDEELGHLPHFYREPLVLCCLEGLSREEAAIRLGWTPGSVKARLERGRKQLSAALIRRGIVPGATLLAATGSSSADAHSKDLFTSIQLAVEGSPSDSASALAREFVMHGIFTKTRLLATVVVGLFGIGIGLAAIASTPRADKAESARIPAVGAADIKDEKPKPTKEASGKSQVKATPPYSLKEEEVLKLILPSAERRDDVYQQLMKGTDIPHERNLMVIKTDGSSLNLTLAGSRRQIPKPGGGWQFTGWSLHELIENAFGVSAPTIIAEDDVLNSMVDADLLMRSKVPRGKLLAALAKELKASGWGEFSIMDRDLELPCIVARGDYKQPEKGILDLFADERQAEPAGKAFTDTNQLFKNLANFIGIPVVDESSLSEKNPKGVVIHTHFRVPFTAETRAADSDPEKVLKHLTEQTGLTYKLERRKQRFILIDRVNGGDKK